MTTEPSSGAVPDQAAASAGAAWEVPAARKPVVYGRPAVEQQRAYAATGTYTGAARYATAEAAPVAEPVPAAPSRYDFRASAVAEPVPPPVVVAPGHPEPVRSGHVAVGVGRLIAWQLAAASVLVAYRVDVIVAVAVAAVALVLVAPTVIRFRGRRLYRWFGVWMRYRGRPRSAPLTDAGPGLDLLTFAESSAALTSAELDDREIALITHRGGLCAVLALGPDESTLLAGEPTPLPSPVALLPGSEAYAMPVTAQLLVAVRPSPVIGPGVVERSYRELTGGEVPARRSGWLVLQTMRTADTCTDDDLRPALLSAIRRARRHLRVSTVDARILDRDGLLTAVGHLGGMSGRPAVIHHGEAPRAAGREGWRGLHLDEVPHVCHRVTRWPTAPWHPEDLLGRSGAVGGVLSVSVAHGTSRTAEGDDVLVEIAFRLSAPEPTRLAAGEKALEQAIRDVGGRSERMDGEQSAGLAGTLPFGGFLR